MRTANVVAVGVVVAALATGCGAKRVDSVTTLEGVDAGRRVRVEGTLLLVGSTPFTTSALAIDSTESIALDTKVPGLRAQLKGLTGMRCALEGDVLPFVSNALPRLSVTRYDLLPLPDGRVPIVGIASMEDGQCVVTTDDGKRYWIQGDHVRALTDYAGARVWISGDAFDTDVATRPAKSTPLTVHGYGVVEEAPSR